MAKLVFVTGPTTSGKTQYINRDRGHSSVVHDEAAFNRTSLSEIDTELRLGNDVYVSWTLPEWTKIEWVPESKR